MNNAADVNIGLIAVSRDCFPAELSKKRRVGVAEHCRKQNIPVTELETIVESDSDVLKALEEVRAKNINVLVLYLGNFGPEGPTALMAKRFGGPVMIAAAAEETMNDLYGGRGDAYCGLLSVSYNLGLRNLTVHIPPSPVGLTHEVAGMIGDFMPVARILLGLRNLKIFSFGPRPHDFLTCHAPIKPLFDLGVEIMENSELDMYNIFLEAKGDPRIPGLTREMAGQLDKGNTYPELLEKLAQFEIALMDYMEKHLGASRFALFANKCWPSFEKFFGFVPCSINGRMAAKGIPISCESDIYGGLSEYIAACASGRPPAILDINNTVPPDMYAASRALVGDYTNSDLFMGFHCGNTSIGCMVDPAMKYQIIMHRIMEPGKEPDITRGTVEGQIKAGEMTIFRLQATPEAQLRAYLAEGEILNIDPKSFGSVAVFAVPEMGRFYRHVLLEKRFPHHTAVAFSRCGKPLFEAMKAAGVADVSFNRPKGMLYEGEHPFGHAIA